MNQAWILLFLPLVAAAANQLYLKRNAFIASMVSVVSVAITFAISLMLLGKTDVIAPLKWATVGNFSIELGIKLDQLSTGMMVVVTGIGLLVHVFSLAYMADDSAKARYFTCLSLFMFSMTGIVLSSNFIMTFMFWELVGLSSYLLVGHWYQKPSAADAAKKAFITNRVGDFGFMIGILMLWGITGTLTFDNMEIPAGVSTGVLGAALLCVFCGAVGKSAQMPLHVWLPDAMEGPTPVSALIHAATMVAAGVYMLFRVQLSIGTAAFDNFAGDTIAIVGGVTSLCAALMATQQNDIKRVLAYSTLSQLGYMVMAVGLLHGEAGMFHLFTHAWFKALLFLGSGAIIYACHHEQDIWNMGGLAKKMPITTLTFLAGYLALIAVPGTAGFFSKEQILEAAHHHPRLSGLFWVAAAVALLTAFYMTRLFVVTFLGKTRTEESGHAHEVGPLMFVPLVILGVLGLIAGYPAIASKLAPVYEAPEHLFHFSGLVPMTSITAVILGVVAGFVLYSGKDKDPISIPFFRDRFKIDDLYDNVIVRYFQDAFAAIIHFFDEFLINGLIVGGSGRIAESFGGLFRRVQSGNLQGYAFAFGLGVILVIYFTVF
ncbi:NADH-quinone oxidoreductase subunit L [Luteolibacter luteus]|uniref:NADH-quinone oxidoreductase subunit L n=1 Tax=Luteolibacter luteus TaxID=2728835 RepID=A0A858RP02_9BACT|nr:NADH-quinone oxidoreductase subunit L [Luteolibacter luteus]QJE98757.1 NADH-quinone oxidoreductase subunit L [Luteolibacter luteus]